MASTSKFAALIAFAFALRVAVGLGPYSGAQDPPKFGDYEAQRHWMELAIHLKPSEWYVNSTRNDFSWWGLDYPPLSGYQSWLHGKLLTKMLLPAEERDRALALTRESRGYESAASKRAMRAAVLASDALVWFPCVLVALYVFSSSPAKKNKEKNDIDNDDDSSSPLLLWPAAVALLQPALLLIDHGHFQFNGIGLGLSAAAAAAAATDRRILASVLFTLSLNHKQMSLYYAPAFFGHLLGRCLESSRKKNERAAGAAGRNQRQQRRKEGTSSSPSSASALLFLVRAALSALALGATVAATMILVWWPVIPKQEKEPLLAENDGTTGSSLPSSSSTPSSKSSTFLSGALAVLSRLAPVQRGVFEDYVSNFWCASHPLFKWKRRFSRERLATAAAALTSAASAPSTLHQVLWPSRRGMLYAMACSALAFYLFSYQVHEKSILLPLMPVTLLAATTRGRGNEDGQEEGEETLSSSSETFLACWLPVAACFSMWPLLERDGLAWSYCGSLVLWIGVVVASEPSPSSSLAAAFVAAASAGALALHACHALLTPPPSLPWLWDAVITAYSSMFFFAAFFYLNWRMWKSGSKSRREGERETTSTTTRTRAAAASAAPRRAGPGAIPRRSSRRLPRSSKDD